MYFYPLFDFYQFISESFPYSFELRHDLSLKTLSPIEGKTKEIERTLFEYLPYRLWSIGHLFHFIKKVLDIIFEFLTILLYADVVPS